MSEGEVYSGFYAWLDAGVELGVDGRPVVPTRTLCRAWKDMGRDDWLETIVPGKPVCRVCLKEWQLVQDSRWKPLETIRKGWVCLSEDRAWCGRIHARRALAEGHAMRAPGWRIRKLTGDELRALVAAEREGAISRASDGSLPAVQPARPQEPPIGGSSGAPGTRPR